MTVNLQLKILIIYTQKKTRSRISLCVLLKLIEHYKPVFNLLTLIETFEDFERIIALPDQKEVLRKLLCVTFWAFKFNYHELPVERRQAMLLQAATAENISLAKLLIESGAAVFPYIQRGSNYPQCVVNTIITALEELGFYEEVSHLNYFLFHPTPKEIIKMRQLIIDSPVLAQRMANVIKEDYNTSVKLSELTQQAKNKLLYNVVYTLNAFAVILLLHVGAELKSKTLLLHKLLASGRYEHYRNAELSSYYGQVEINVEAIMRALLEHGADANEGHKLGRSPLMRLVDSPYDEDTKIRLADLLIEQGGDPNIQDNQRESAIDRAQLKQLGRLANFLENKWHTVRELSIKDIDIKHTDESENTRWIFFGSHRSLLISHCYENESLKKTDPKNTEQDSSDTRPAYRMRSATW